MQIFQDQKAGFFCTLSYILFIYSTLGIVRNIQEILFPYQTYIISGIFLIFSLVLVHYLIRFRVKNLKNYVALGVIVVVYTYLFFHWGVAEAERIHLVQYGILGFLVYFTLKFSFRGISLYLLSFLIVFAAGFVDEGIQYFLPNRFYDFNDVLLNGFSGGLALLLLAFVFEDRSLQTEKPHGDDSFAHQEI